MTWLYKAAKAIYHIDKTIRENSMVIDDGLHEIFVNTVVDDGSDIADLMSCFTKKQFINNKFPALTKQFNFLKSEGGASAVCEIMEKYINEGRAEERKEERLSAIQKMIKKGFDKELILSLDYTEEEYDKAEKSFLQLV